jgi:two-component system, NtrC family, sensor histidine kinase PilS
LFKAKPIAVLSIGASISLRHDIPMLGAKLKLHNWFEAGVRAHQKYSDSYWRSLFYFNVYRLVVALLVLSVGVFLRRTVQFGSYDFTLFVVSGLSYIGLSIVWFALIRMRWWFNLQLTLQVMADIFFIVVLIFASSGISSGLGLLLLATLAAAGLISRGRLTLFHAAVASLAILGEHAFEVLRFSESPSLFVQAGLLSIGYFATAWVAHTLARYSEESEQLAAQRGIDLENLAEVNRLVIQDMPDGVFVVDGDGVIRQFNVRVERILGPLSGRGEVRLEDYAPALARRFADWRVDSGAISSMRATAENPDLGARFEPVGGNTAGALIFIEDISRIQAEARQMKLAALGRLTANIAHEIRNPLGAISHAAELLHEEQSVSDTTQRLIRIIGDNTHRLNRMVNDVLGLNRGQSVRPETFAVAEYIETVIVEFAETEAVMSSVFAFEVRTRPLILFDRGHLHQVLWNLCQNALRHCARQDGSVRIVVDSVRGGRVVKLDVIDDGPGVASAVRAELFEPFVTAAAGGTGLGLYIARELCAVNGASLDHVETPTGANFVMHCKAGL